MDIICLYRYESQLVQTFNKLFHQKKISISGNFIQDYASEFDYRNGRVDIISKSNINELIAFEAKLTNWKKALNQAYRNTAFAHYSFVLLPFETALKAMSWENEFNDRGVGICTFNGKNFEVILNSRKTNPIQPWLTREALKYIKQSKYEQCA